MEKAFGDTEGPKSENSTCLVDYTWEGLVFASSLIQKSCEVMSTCVLTKKKRVSLHSL